MSSQSKPVLLSFQMPEHIYLSKLLPTDCSITDWRKLLDYVKNNPLPYCLDKSITFSPMGYLIVTNSIIEPIQGWQLITSNKWREAPKNDRNFIIKNALDKHIKRIPGVSKIGGDWSYKQEEVNEENGRISTIYHCLSAKYVEIGDLDGISYDFIRKVRSSLSINDELNKGIFPYGEDDWNSVMVTVSSGEKEFSSGILMKIDENSNLNLKFDGSEDTVREYDAKKGFFYSDYESENTCIIYVKMGKKTWPYAASRVFRILRIEDWGGMLKNSMKEILRLKPTDFEKHLNKGLRMLRGFRFAGEILTLDFNTDIEWNVKVAEVSDICMLSDSDSKMLFNGKWKHNIKNNSKLSQEPLPPLQITYCLHKEDIWAIPILKKYSNSVLSLVPDWKYHDFEEILLLEGSTQTEIKQSIRNEIKKIANFSGENIILSALRPSRPGMETYTWLKRQLTEKDFKHQNYLIYADQKFKAPYQSSTHEINICQLLMKFGRLPVPFSIKLGDIDMTIGVDIGRLGANRSRPSMAVSIDKFGCMWGGSVSSEPQSGEEMSNRTIRDLLDNQINYYKTNTGHLPKRLVILRDGNSSNQELNDMNEICNEWVTLGVDISWITVQKSGTPRLLIYDGRVVQDELPVPESYLVTNKCSSWCWTTGGSVGRFPGIPRGFSFRVERNFSDQSLDIEQWSRLLIAQAKTSQVNPYANTRLPFTLHLADKMAKAQIRGSIPPDYSGNGFPAC